MTEEAKIDSLNLEAVIGFGGKAVLGPEANGLEPPGLLT